MDRWIVDSEIAISHMIMNEDDYYFFIFIFILSRKKGTITPNRDKTREIRRDATRYSVFSMCLRPPSATQRTIHVYHQLQASACGVNTRCCLDVFWLCRG